MGILSLLISDSPKKASLMKETQSLSVALRHTYRQKCLRIEVDINSGFPSYWLFFSEKVLAKLQMYMALEPYFTKCFVETHLIIVMIFPRCIQTLGRESSPSQRTSVKMQRISYWYIYSLQTDRSYNNYASCV